MAFTSRTLGLARAAIAAAGRVVDGAVRALTAAWVKAWDAIAGAFTAAVAALLAGRDAWPGRRDIESDPGLQAALDDAARALDTLTDLTVTEATSAADRVVGGAAEDQAEVIASQFPPGRIAPVARPGGFHQRAVDAITARTRQRIISLTRPLTADADAAMRRELVRGVTVGENPRESARRMVRQVEGAFNGGLTRATAIARTEVLDAYRQAAAAAQEVNGDVVRGWVWLAELSPRTCAACWSLHGTEHPLTEPGPLGHVNCRCARAPRTVSWRDLGFDLDEPEDVIADAEVVFRALPRDQQVAIMGSARLQLLLSGRVSWGELARRRENPGWRDSMVPVPVRDLAAR